MLNNEPNAEESSKPYPQTNANAKQKIWQYNDYNDKSYSCLLNLVVLLLVGLFFAFLLFVVFGGFCSLLKIHGMDVYTLVPLIVAITVFGLALWFIITRPQNESRWLRMFRHGLYIGLGIFIVALYMLWTVDYGSIGRVFSPVTRGLS
ncbi:hypothetical protein [Candidatus Chlorohelix sp.]|uniref:hypothetical protein n=1 Tax=Candidatus Chlorohelix sp. TaxID=3139201 RepID=UPI003049F7DC